MLLQVKRFSEKLLLPLGRKLVKFPANYITVFGLISAIFTFLGFIFQCLIIIIVFIFLTEFFDQLDGVIARLQGPTKLGSFLDSTLDRVGDFLIFIGVIFGGYTSIEIGIITLIGTFLTSYIRIKIESLGINKIYGIGLIERTDRVLILFIGAVLQIWFPTAIFYVILFLAITTNFTAVQRFVFAYRRFTQNKRISKVK
jgi:phosphatidylglycerophosphate synthase